MTKFIDNGLFVDPRWKHTPFAGILLANHNVTNGAKFTSPVMVISVAGNPGPGETFGMGGTTFTFVAAGATGTQVNIGATAAETAANMIVKMNEYRRTIGCTAYPLRKATLILCVDGTPGTHLTSPTFHPDSVPNIVEDMPWMNKITGHMLTSADYFRIGTPWDVDTKPIVLTERNAGTYQNFLY
jgi:hypothetical protein